MPIIMFVFRMIGWGGHICTAFITDNGEGFRVNKKRNQGGNCLNDRLLKAKTGRISQKNTQAKSAKTNTETKTYERKGMEMAPTTIPHHSSSADERNSVVEIKDIQINRSMPPAQRIREYIRQVGDPYHFMTNGTEVAFRFHGDKRLTDCLSNVLKTTMRN